MLSAAERVILRLLAQMLCDFPLLWFLLRRGERSHEWRCWGWKWWTVTVLRSVVLWVSLSCCCVFRYLSASATLDDIAQSEVWVEHFLFSVLLQFLHFVFFIIHCLLFSVCWWRTSVCFQSRSLRNITSEETEMSLFKGHSTHFKPENVSIFEYVNDSYSPKVL